MVENSDKVNRKNAGPAGIVVSKFELNRNVVDYSFNPLLSEDKKKELEEQTYQFLKNRGEKVKFYPGSLDNEKRRKFNFNSGYLDYEGQENKLTFLFLSQKKAKIIFNDIDHFKICLLNRGGLDFHKLYRKMMVIEKIIEENYQFCANQKYGYLSPEMTNCGLSVKLSALIHIPATIKVKKKSDLKDDLLKRGYTLKEWQGNIDKTSFYVIYSNLNYGLTEDELINRFEIGLNQLLEGERDLLKDYYKNNNDLDDMIYRSLGLLQYAKTMDYNEALYHLSNVLKGISLGIDLPGINKTNLMEIILGIREDHIDFFANKHKINSNEARAMYVRSKLL